ncbi:hypothetical protein QFC24_002730 [Naganishia onofrii]|uniref:Uncharacterized protein n=1 Tax=Naganishia onofrii TaxID=1851511 RepID=A0ACC2XQM9_9TREE|nr:hypothetical protein QFC24_002730 [Naganishia onofrii]
MEQESGKKLDAKSVTPIFEEEAQKVAKLPGISAHQVNIAKDYMLKQLSQQWPSDFLTTDLQQYLEADDTKSKL